MMFPRSQPRGGGGSLGEAAVTASATAASQFLVTACARMRYQRGRCGDDIAPFACRRSHVRRGACDDNMTPSSRPAGAFIISAALQTTRQPSFTATWDIFNIFDKGADLTKGL